MGIGENEPSEIKDLWVSTIVQGEAVMLCVDSGASKVTLTPEQYRQIPQARRPPLKEEKVYLRQADGSRVQIMGSAYMEVQVGGHTESVPVLCCTS